MIAYEELKTMLTQDNNLDYKEILLYVYPFCRRCKKESCMMLMLLCTVSSTPLLPLNIFADDRLLVE